MKKVIVSLILGLLLISGSYASSHCNAAVQDTINDGPYIFLEKNKLKARNLTDGNLQVTTITQENFPELKSKYNLIFGYKDLKDAFLIKPRHSQKYNSVDSLAVISDIHGEFHAYLRLLKAAGIIDEDLNWTFGKGHLVILGDSFDRGTMVTELLWHIFGLEQQAARAGGKVHVILGNHEFMVLTNDLAYINEKYRMTGALLGKSYADLYSTNSVLGNWLRSKPIIITINDMLFVHAGISTEMVNRKITLEQVNMDFYDMLSGEEKIVTDSIYNKLLFLVDNNGPVWYRGYFNEQDFSENKTDSILNFYRVKHIIVGHTHCDGITNIFKNKIFGVDAGMSNKEPGEMLIYKNGKFFRGLSTGERFEL